MLSPLQLSSVPRLGTEIPYQTPAWYSREREMREKERKKEREGGREREREKERKLNALQRSYGIEDFSMPYMASKSIDVTIEFS